jgi:Ribonuclease G/E
VKRCTLDKIASVTLRLGLDRNAVLGELNRALARDHTRITVSGFTQLGLVEMTPLHRVTPNVV